MTLTNAYLLVSHGSRDPRPQIALERLSYLVQQQIRDRVSNRQQGIPPYPRLQRGVGNCLVLSPHVVETASLELSDLLLSQKIIQVALEGEKQGIEQLNIIPLFLLPGVHVAEDIPREVAIAQRILGSSIKLNLCPYLGSYQGLTKILSRQFSPDSQDARIIIAHGSRRSGGNDSVEAIAYHLQARVAYWSMAPSLEDQVYRLMNQQKTRITIVPYFLFPGSITTAIAQQVQQLQTRFPQIQLNLGHPLGATPDLAALMVEEITQ